MVVGVFCLKVVETGEQNKCYQAARFGGEGIQGSEDAPGLECTEPAKQSCSSCRAIARLLCTNTFL